nr:zinc finger, CCHC-type [Tanacetum cinerariifolium]
MLGQTDTTTDSSKACVKFDHIFLQHNAESEIVRVIQKGLTRTVLKLKPIVWPPRVTLGRLLPHARGLGFKPRRGGFPSGAKKEWGLSPKAKVRVLHTAQLDVTMTTSPANNSVFRGFFEKQKLTGPNFIDWYLKLRIVLSIEDKLNYLEQPISPDPVALEGVKNSVCPTSGAGASLDYARFSLLQAGGRAVS